MPDNLLPPPNDPQKILGWVDRIIRDFDTRLGFVEKFFRDTNGHSVPGRLKNLEKGMSDIHAAQQEAASVARAETEKASDKRVRHWHLAVTVLAAILGNQGATQVLKPTSVAPNAVSAPAPALDVEALKQSIVKALLDQIPPEAPTAHQRVVKTPRKHVDPPSTGLIDSSRQIPYIK